MPRVFLPMRLFFTMYVYNQFQALFYTTLHYTDEKLMLTTAAVRVPKIIRYPATMTSESALPGSMKS